MYSHRSFRDATSSGCGESGIPHHPASFKSGEERGLQGSIMHHTGAEPHVWEEVIQENAWYWLAAVPRTVTWGERSICTQFYVCFSRFLDGTSAD